ncbi:40S ribosomal protein S27-2 [Tanacetum coccineum]
MSFPAKHGCGLHDTAAIRECIQLSDFTYVFKRYDDGWKEGKGGNVMVLYASVHHDISIVVTCLVGIRWIGIAERLGKDYLERAKKMASLTLNRKQAICSKRESHKTCSTIAEMIRMYSFTDLLAFTGSHTQFGLKVCSSVSSGTYQTIEHIRKNQRRTTQTTSQKSSLPTDLYAYVPEPIKVSRVKKAMFIKWVNGDNFGDIQLFPVSVKTQFALGIAALFRVEMEEKWCLEVTFLAKVMLKSKSHPWYFKCEGYFNIHAVFNRSQPTLGYGNRHNVTCQPRGGRERLAEGCSFQTKGD